MLLEDFIEIIYEIIIYNIVYNVNSLKVLLFNEFDTT